MRKLIALIITATVVCATFALQARAQTTATVGVDFGLLFRAPSDPRPIKIAPGHLRWVNAMGRTETVVTADSAGTDTLRTPLAARGKPVTHVVAADSASLFRMYGTNQRSWVITVTDTVRLGPDSIRGNVRLSILDVASGNAKDTTLFITSAGLFVPKLVNDSISVGFAPFDSIRVRDRTVITWITSQWQ